MLVVYSQLLRMIRYDNKFIYDPTWYIQNEKNTRNFEYNLHQNVTNDSENLKLEMTVLFTKPDTSIQTKEICNQIKIPLLKMKISLFKINIPIIIE